MLSPKNRCFRRQKNGWTKKINQRLFKRLILYYNVGESNLLAQKPLPSTLQLSYHGFDPVVNRNYHWKSREMEYTMRKRFMQLAAALLTVCLAIPPAGAATTNSQGEIMIRVGLASSSSHVPTGELEAAHLENNNSAGYGFGYRFGYYDSNLDFVELARTAREEIKVAVLKTQNLYYGHVASLDKNTYSASITSDILVGCYHVRVPGSFGSFEEASAEAERHSGGFVAWIDGAYQVRAGSYSTQGEAQAAADNLEGGSVVWTSSYGMNVVKTGTNRIFFQYDCGESGKLAIQPDVTGLEETRTWFLNYKYRGGFQFHRRGGGNITVVNVLPLEDYVNGVVCYEMGRNWPLEALKAQALCARTYVLKNLNKHNSYGFDICTTASCQAYHGMGSNRTDFGPSEVSMQAVAETAGMVIRYGGKLAETFYSSSHGGASEDANYIWGTNTATEHPYLRGVTDPYEADASGINANASWTVSYTAAQLARQLQNTNASVDHLVLTYSDKGNVVQVVVHWTNGQKNTISAGSIRSRFGVKSIRFTVNGAGTGGESKPETPAAGTEDLYINGSKASEGLDGAYVITGSGSVSGLDGTPHIITGTGSVSALEAPSGPDQGGGQGGSSSQPGGGTVTVSGDSYTFTGAGWGHQVGMSQYGAYAMANRGFTGGEIIGFYFPGVQIEKY